MKVYYQFYFIKSVADFEKNILPELFRSMNIKSRLEDTKQTGHGEWWYHSPDDIHEIIKLEIDKEYEMQMIINPGDETQVPVWRKKVPNSLFERREEDQIIEVI